MHTLYKLFLGIFFSLITLSSLAENNSTIADAFKNGDANYLLRYRFENVDQDDFNKDANASTLKARLSFKTDDNLNFGLFTEFDTVIAFGKEQYNSGQGTSGPERAIYPIIADPDGTEVNQAYLSYKGFPDTLLKFGRQRILIDNQRFVGGVGWRQNEQTYDGISIDKNFNAMHLIYAYISNVNRIFGEDVAAGDHNSRTHLLNLKHNFNSGELTAYYYSIDNKDAISASTNTIGLRWNAKDLFNNSALSYSMEYASQTDNADNPVNYTADYYRLDASYQFKYLNFYTGYEVLSGEATMNGASFQTPLATLHAFNGWADQFLSTPAEGLEDLFFGIKGNLKRFNWNVKYHNFSAQDVSSDFGNELDFSVSTTLSKHYSILLKYADFNSDTSNRSDTEKIWLMLQAKF